MGEEEKRYYTTEEVARLYGVGIKQAQKIVGEIKKMNKGRLALGRGKVLPRELAAWENAAPVQV